jgi:gamma-glutamylcyclotransferase (GGCT)/AIG2-like uncharacterized protein YtfP
MAHEGERLFVYGTLLEAAARRRLLDRPVDAHPARLAGFERGRQRHHFVVPRGGAEVAGAIVGGLTARDLAILDEYEDVPRLYTRERIEVIDAAGNSVECWFYLPTGWASRG